MKQKRWLFLTACFLIVGFVTLLVEQLVAQQTSTPFPLPGLPPGLTFTPDGNLTGTPTTPGVWEFTVRVTDSKGVSATKTFQATVAEALTITTGTPLPQGVVGRTYTVTITGTGGVAPLVYSVEVPPAAGVTRTPPPAKAK
jgi:hypothetical protein